MQIWPYETKNFQKIAINIMQNWPYEAENFKKIML